MKKYIQIDVAVASANAANILTTEFLTDITISHKVFKMKTPCIVNYETVHNMVQAWYKRANDWKISRLVENNNNMRYNSSNNLQSDDARYIKHKKAYVDDDFANSPIIGWSVIQKYE